MNQTEVVIPEGGDRLVELAYQYLGLIWNYGQAIDNFNGQEKHDNSNFWIYQARSGWCILDSYIVGSRYWPLTIMFSFVFFCSILIEIQWIKNMSCALKAIVKAVLHAFSWATRTEWAIEWWVRIVCRMMHTMVQLVWLHHSSLWQWN